MDVKEIYAKVLSDKLKEWELGKADDMSDEQRAELWNTQNMEASNALYEASKQEAEKFNEKLSQELAQQRALFDAEIAQQKAAMAELGSKIALRGVVEVGNTDEPLVTQIKRVLEENKKSLGDLSEKSGGSKIKLELKIVGKAATDPIFQEEGNGTVTGGNVPLEYRDPNIVVQRRRSPFITNYLNIQPIIDEGNKITWVEQVSIESNVGGTAEGAAKNQMSFKFEVAEAEVKTRTVFMKVSTRALRRVDQMQAFINSELRRDLLDDYDQQILFGDNTGENLNGLFTIAPAFDGGGLAGTIDNANNYDVLEAALLQLQVAASSTINGAPQAAGFMGNLIVLSPVDATQMKLTKGTDGHYVTPAGMADLPPIVTSNHLSAGQFIVMDSTLATLYPEQNLLIDIGMSGNDFTENMRTILAEHASALVVPQNQYGGFVQGTFAVAKALLETP